MFYLLLIVIVSFLGATEANQSCGCTIIRGDNYNLLALLSAGFLSGWLFRTLALRYQVPVSISYVGIYLTFLFATQLLHNRHFGIELSALHMFHETKVDEAVLYIGSLPAIFITLILRMECSRYEVSPIQLLVLVYSKFICNVAIGVCFLYVMSEFLFDWESADEKSVCKGLVLFLLTANESYETVNLMRNTTRDVKRIANIMHADQYISVFTSFFLLNMATSLLNIKTMEFSHSSWIYIGIMITLCASPVVFFLLIHVTNLAKQDSLAEMSLFLSLIYLFYFLISATIGNSGEILIAIVGGLYSARMSRVGLERLKAVRENWESIDYLNQCVLFTMAGIRCGVVSVHTLGYGLLSALIYHVTSFIISYIFWMIVYPTTNLGNNEVWKFDILVACVATYKTGAPILMAIAVEGLVFEDRHPIIVPFTSFVVILSLLLYVLPFVKILRLMGYYKLNDEEIDHMKSLWRKMNSFRNRTISCFIQGDFARGANSHFVKKLLQFTTPTHTVDKGEKYNEANDESFSDSMDDSFASFKNRIILIQLNSFNSQYQQRMLSFHGYKELVEETFEAIRKNTVILKVTDMSRKWTELESLTIVKNFLLKTVLNSLPLYTDPPRTYKYKSLLRMRILEVIKTRIYQFIMIGLVVADTIATIHLVLYYFGVVSLTERAVLELMVINACAYIIFNIEMALEVFAVGISSHFIKKSRIVLLAEQTVLRSIEYTLFLSDINFPDIQHVDIVVIYVKIILISEIWRAYTFIPMFTEQLLHWVYFRIHNEVERRLHICFALIRCYDQLMDQHIKLVNIDSTTYSRFVRTIQQYKMEVFVFLAWLRKGYPFVDITMKTKLVSQYALNEMKTMYTQERRRGNYGLKELDCAQRAFSKIQHRINTLTIIKAEPVTNFLKNITWIRPSFLEIFERNARIFYMNYADRIIKSGTDPNGIFIVASGKLICKYRPTAAALHRLYTYGQLPNCDLILTKDFSEPQNMVMERGCVIGEIGAVTARRHDMSVSCRTFAEAYHISSSFLSKVTHIADYSEILRCELWKAIARKWAVYLLETSAPYDEWSHEELTKFVDRGVVVSVPYGAPLKLTYFVAELLLIEGIILDTITRKSYYAPRRIDMKAVKSLILGVSLKQPVVVDTKVFLIPKLEANQEDILVEELNTYKGFYEYDYEELRHIVNMESRRAHKYRERHLLKDLKRLDSSLVVMNVSDPLLPSVDEKAKDSTRPESKQRGYIRSIRKVVRHENEAEQLNFVKEPDAQSSSEDENLIKKDCLVKEFKVTRLSCPKSDEEEARRRLMMYEYKYEEPRLSLQINTSKNALETTRVEDPIEDLFTQGSEMPIAADEPMKLPTEHRVSTQPLVTSPARRPQLIIPTSPGPLELYTLKPDQGIRHRFEAPEGQQLGERVPTVIANIAKPEVEFVDWRSLLPSSKVVDQFAQTDMKTLKKKSKFKIYPEVEFEQSLKSLMDETLIWKPSRKKLKSYGVESEPSLMRAVNVRKRFVHKQKLAMDELRKKYKSVYKKKIKLFKEVYDEKIFFDQEKVPETQRKDSSDATDDIEHLKRVTPLIFLKRFQRTAPGERRSQYEIISENRFGESLSSDSKLHLGDDVKQQRLVLRKRRPFKQRRVLVKKNVFHWMAERFSKTMRTKVIPKLVKTTSFFEALKEVDVKEGVVKKRKTHYHFKAPKPVYSILATARFPRLRTPEDSFIKVKKDARVYWSSSSSDE